MQISKLEGMMEYYSAEFSVKVKRGIKENALKAKVNGGQIPFGYYIDEEQKLAINQTLAPIVVEAFTMYADGYLIKDIENRIKNIITAIDQGIIFDSTKDRLAELEKEKSQLDLTIIQEQIKKPFLTKEQIRFGIEKFKKLDISTKEGNKG